KREEVSTMNHPPVSSWITKDEVTFYPFSVLRRCESTIRPKTGRKHSITQGVEKVKQYLKQVLKRSAPNKPEAQPSRSDDRRLSVSMTMDGHTSANGMTVKAMMQRRLSALLSTKAQRDELIAVDRHYAVEKDSKGLGLDVPVDGKMVADEPLC